jgi:hypothetical protein
MITTSCGACWLPLSGQGPQGVKAKDVERAVDRYVPRMRGFKAKAKRERKGRVR